MKFYLMVRLNEEKLFSHDSRKLFNLGKEYMHLHLLEIKFKLEYQYIHVHTLLSIMSKYTEFVSFGHPMISVFEQLLVLV